MGGKEDKKEVPLSEKPPPTPEALDSFAFASLVMRNFGLSSSSNKITPPSFNLLLPGNSFVWYGHWPAALRAYQIGS